MKNVEEKKEIGIIENVYSVPRDKDAKDGEKRDRNFNNNTGANNYKQKDYVKREYNNDKEFENEPEERPENIDSDGFEIVGVEVTKEAKPKKKYDRPYEKREKKPYHKDDGKFFNKGEKTNIKKKEGGEAEVKAVVEDAGFPGNVNVGKSTLKLAVNPQIKKLGDLFN